MATKQTRRGTRATSPTIDVYARISRSDDGTRGRSVDGQVDDGMAEIAARGAVLGKVWRDESLSAWNPRTRRPEFDELMARLESGAADGVWVRELTRFTRKIGEAERLVELADRGVLVWSADDEYDLTKAAGRRHFRDDAVTAANESDVISERTSRGKLKRAQRGKSNQTWRGFAAPGYLPNPPGWMAGDPRVPVPDDQLAAEVAAAREVAAMVLAGRSWADCARYCNDLGLTTNQGKQFSGEAIRQVMERPGLAGIAIYRGEPVGALEGEPVLDLATWQRVQSVIASRRPGRPTTTRYLLSSVLICGRCGHRLTGRPVGTRPPNPDGSPVLAYWCPKRVGERSGCGRLTVDADLADEVVTAATLRRLGDPRHADLAARQAAEVAAARADLVAEVERLEADAASLATKVAAWGLARVESAMQPLDARLEVLRERLIGLETPDDATTASDALAQWHAYADAGDTVALRGLVARTFPNGIAVAAHASMAARDRLDPARFDFGREIA